MIPVVIFWTKYTATLNGRVLKLVPCESCSTEYVYFLDREGTGVGTSVYGLNAEGAQDNAASAAEESLREYLENDFDPVPCPVCGHYQRHMFPKLYAPPVWLPVVRLAAVVGGSVAAVAALYETLTYLQRLGGDTLRRMTAAWAVVAAFVLLVVGLGAVEQSRSRRFDPNAGDRQARMAEGRRRAFTRAEFEAAQLRERENRGRI
ncbi:MAG TPA: hypothetical protein VMG10_08925 [Gemmataceae bacterium]|nr:hypothetical protein [Gemmataceae bacterium]